jgi:hypothetical protein
MRNQRIREIRYEGEIKNRMFGWIVGGSVGAGKQEIMASITGGDQSLN